MKVTVSALQRSQWKMLLSH